MQFRILGGLRVERAGAPLELGGPKQRAVLGALLVDPGRPVPADRLEHLVWADQPPANPETSLQAYISNLRRALEPERKPREPARLLVTQAAGYALLTDRSSVDVARFEDLVAAGQAALRAGDVDEAAARFDEALTAWAGPPLPELAGRAWVDELGTYVEGLRADAVEGRIEAGLRRGDHTTLVPVIERAVAEAPFRERRRAQLALALYRSGRQREALAALAQARSVLIDEVGVEPGPELRQLEADILAHAPALQLAPGATHTAPPRTNGVASPITAVEDLPASAVGEGSDGGRPFVGRTRELDVLLAAADAAGRGAGRPVVISGEPGIGKTRLVEELVARLPDALVAWGRCPESAAGAAFWPCIQLGRQLEGADALDGDLVTELLPEPDIDISPTADRFGLHVAVASLLATTDRLLVLVVDDLQWADQSSLRLIEYVSGELHRTRVLLVITVRPVTTDAPGPLVDCLGELARQPGVVRVELSGLGTADVSDWLAARSGHAADRRVAEVVHDRSGGNPFFVGEIIELLTAGGRAVDVDAVRSGTAVPGAVQDVVRRRVSRLPVDTQQLLTAASVLGRTFDLDVLAAVVGADVAALLDQIEPAVQTGLVDDTDLPGRFQFSHALVAETLTAEVSATRRARLHAATARSLATLRASDLDGHLAELAHHAVEGAIAGTAAEAYTWSTKAARQATLRLAHEEAAEHWSRATRALELARPGDAEARFEALYEEGMAWLRVDAVDPGYTALVRALDLAVALGEPGRVAQAAAAMSIDGVWNTGEVALTSVDAVSALERALALLPDTPSVERVLATGAMAEAAYWVRPAEWLAQVTAQAVADARAVGDPEALGRALHKRNVALWRAAYFAERAEAAEELLAIAQEHDLPPILEAIARFGMAGVSWERADVTAAQIQAAIAQQLAQTVSSPALMTQLDWFNSTLAQFAGRLDEAEMLADRAFELYRRTRRWSAETLDAGLRMVTRMEQGRLDDIRASFELIVDSPYRPWFQEGFAYALVELGHVDEAATVLEGARLPPLMDCWMFMGLVAAATHVRVALGDRDAVATLADHLRPYQGRLATSGTGSAFGDVHLALAAAARFLGDEDAARHHADASVGVLGAAGAGPDLVRALLLRADVAPEGAAADRARATEIVERLDLPLLRTRLA